MWNGSYSILFLKWGNYCLGLNNNVSIWRSGLKVISHGQLLGVLPLFWRPIFTAWYWAVYKKSHGLNDNDNQYISCMVCLRNVYTSYPNQLSMTFLVHSPVSHAVCITHLAWHKNMTYIIKICVDLELCNCIYVYAVLKIKLLYCITSNMQQVQKILYIRWIHTSIHQFILLYIHFPVGNPTMCSQAFVTLCHLE